jgi:hypothetical protein
MLSTYVHVVVFYFILRKLFLGARLKALGRKMCVRVRMLRGGVGVGVGGRWGVMNEGGG